MANKTIKDAKTVHGTNPQYLVEKIIRTRIYECRYWKEECFGLAAELIVDKAAELRYIGGIYGGNIKPTPFLCLTLKLLQIQPDKDIIIEFIRQDHFKYLRALAVYYLRLTGTSLEVYKYLEPLYNDFRKLRRMDGMGQFDIIYMDEFIDMLLREDRVFDIILPRLTKRFLHIENGELQGPRESLVNMELDEDEEEENDAKASGDDRREVAQSSSDDEMRSSHHRCESGRDRGDSRSPSRRSHHHRSSRRSRSHSRERGDRRQAQRSHRDRSRSPESSSKRRRRQRDDSDSDDERQRSRKPKTEAEEIAEMNALRAKLGLAPLRP